MSFLVKVQTTAANENGETNTHFAGDVVSDWELSSHIRDEVMKGTPWYTSKFEPLTDKEAELYRVKATATEGKRTAPDGQEVDPPWRDFKKLLTECRTLVLLMLKRFANTSALVLIDKQL